MSSCTRPMVAAKIEVTQPTTATTASALGAIENTALVRTIMYTPAVTMVAAWINALTGVGPSIASGSHTYNGSCADFPVAPANSSKQIQVSTPAWVALSAGMFAAFMNTVPKSTEPNVQKSSN